MVLSLEISMYPLQEAHIPKIEEFLQDLLARSEELDVRITNMSTRVFGDFDQVTTLINSAMKKSMKQHGRIVFVCKYLTGDVRELKGYA